MRKNRKANWGITHCLTPKILSKPEINWDNVDMPELPSRKKSSNISPVNKFNPYKDRSRKHRLM